MFFNFKIVCEEAIFFCIFFAFLMEFIYNILDVKAVLVILQ